MNKANAECLQSVIQVLIEQRDIANSNDAPLAGQLIDLAIVQLRLMIHNISEEEFSQFSNFLRFGLTKDGPSN
jgi:hypothetical protein